MSKIQNTTNVNSYPNNNGNNNDGDNNLYKVKLAFSPQELGVKGNRPQTVVLTEQQVESKIFEKYGFNPKNRLQMEMLKLRFDTKDSPYSEIDWGKGKFVAQLNSSGQYEISVGLRERTIEALEGRLINAPTANNNGNLGDTTASRTGYDASRLKQRQIQQNLPTPDLTGLTPEQKELVLDLTQVGLSVVGIFDPTGIADGADAVVSLGRGDYWGAGISALGIIPYLGDLAKIGKLPKLLKTIEKVVDVAKQSPAFAKVVEPLLKGLKAAIDKLPIDKLPNWAKEPIQSMKNKIDEYFGAGKTPNGVEPPKTPKPRTEPPQVNKVEVDGVMLPATTKESVDNKLWTYLLDPNHIQGGPKAKWFKEALGFTRENMDDLAKQIVFDPAKAVKTAEIPQGQKFNQVITIVGANGKKIDVNFGWIQNNDGIVRLTTAIPAKK